MSDLEYRIVELERKLVNMIMDGVIAELDEDAARVKVQYAEDDKGGPVLTDWLPWFANRAGPDRDWNPPEPGEPVVIFSLNGDLAQGRVMPALYSDTYPAPANKKTVRRVEFADGGFAEYDRGTGKWKVSAEGLATLIGKGGIELVGKNGGAVKGIIQGDCLCSFTGAPHVHISSSVKATD
jgi:phage baseplate assembly protein V